MSKNTLYDDLQSNEIRMMELLPGDPGVQIECRLFKVALDDRPDYEAMSYVWGDPTITDTILCNGHTVHITVSLAQALRQLRPRHGESPFRTLWADAICIDQSNVVERNSQVSLMTHIYSGATKVVVWAGPEETKAVATAIVAINHVHSVYYQSIGGKVRLDLADDSVDFLSVQHLERYIQEQGLGDVWGSTMKLFSLPYWGRVWCVQEAILAPALTVLVGSEKIIGEAIAIFTEWYLHKMTESVTAGETSDHDFLVFATGMVAKMLNYNRWNSIAEDTDLSETLDTFREAHATDPRDKVYGLLGVHTNLTGMQPAIEVDYMKTEARVYIEAALLDISRTGGLSVLSYVEHGREYDTGTKYPSWIPRWDRTLSAGHLYVHQYGASWFAGRNIVVTPDQPLALSGILPVQGISFDEVSTTSTILPGNSWLEKDPHFKNLFSGLWLEVNRADSAYPHHISIAELAATITGGYAAYMVDFMEDWNHVEGLFKSLEDIDSDLGLQYLSNFRSFVRMMKLPDFEVESPRGNGHAFASLAGAICCTKRIFRTRRGYLGLGPGCMQEGDFVVVLDRGRTPYILRRLEGSTYAFMGECFVYEIMNGQAYDMTDEDGVKEQVFELH